MGGSPDVTTKPAPIPDELKPLVNAAVQQALQLQQALPIAGFASPNPQAIPGLNPALAGLIGQSIGLSQLSPISGPEMQGLSGLSNVMAQLSGLGGAPSPSVGGPLVARPPTLLPGDLASLFGPGTIASKGGGGIPQAGQPGGPLIPRPIHAPSPPIQEVPPTDQG